MGPTPVLLPGKSHGWRSLLGCNLLGHQESDATEWLQFSLLCVWEGNGNPLKCSCLENPRDRGAWWAAVYGVTQSRTWLKWLSSSSRVGWQWVRNPERPQSSPGLPNLLFPRISIFCLFYFFKQRWHWGFWSRGKAEPPGTSTEGHS